MDRFRLAKSSRDDRFLSKNRNQAYGSFVRPWSFPKTNSGCTNQKHVMICSVLSIGHNAIRPKNPTQTQFSKD